MKLLHLHEHPTPQPAEINPLKSRDSSWVGMDTKFVFRGGRTSLSHGTSGCQKENNQQKDCVLGGS